ncbi:hypothetical protein FGO68_gene905 [Halteria grandinella]|uniref:Uncharacterized protein n=1 Tax=Halteria grandinella TaxID=5974 RepID=A0A8J8T2M0_HALGN|nr:hypothetical protein FGO68_gene905 [Halteria grandinella]
MIVNIQTSPLDAQPRKPRQSSPVVYQSIFNDHRTAQLLSEQLLFLRQKGLNQPIPSKDQTSDTREQKQRHVIKLSHLQQVTKIKPIKVSAHASPRGLGLHTPSKTSKKIPSIHQPVLSQKHSRDKENGQQSCSPSPLCNPLLLNKFRSPSDKQLDTSESKKPSYISAKHEGKRSEVGASKKGQPEQQKVSVQTSKKPSFLKHPTHLKKPSLLGSPIPPTSDKVQVLKQHVKNNPSHLASPRVQQQQSILAKLRSPRGC